MPILYLYKSKTKDKKYTMVYPQGKKRFGAKTYRDYTLINDPKSKFYLPNKEDREKVKRSYKARHKKDKGLGNYKSSSELAMELLWNKPTLDASIKAFERKHNVKINKMF
tara:strand:+ start:249 stop:578 length:330 start_codon:yes stop_codon:yes gene_type:complete